MYGVLAVVCCDTCTPGPDKGVPAETCPDEPETPHEATVTITVSVDPKQYCPIQSYTCEGSDYCDGAIYSNVVTCETCAVEFPTPVLAGGFGEAKISSSWPTYRDGTSCADCGSDIQSLGGNHSDTFNVTLTCDGAGATEAFGTSGIDGISGSAVVDHCCDDCDCGPFLCTRITVTLTAQWTKTISVPTLANGGCWDCDGFHYAGQIYKIGAATDVEWIGANGVTIVFERTVLVSQANERLAPGNYVIKSVTASTMVGWVSAFSPGPWSGPCDWAGDCSCWSTYPSGFITEAETCGDSLLATHGWSVSLSVTA